MEKAKSSEKSISTVGELLQTKERREIYTTKTTDNVLEAAALMKNQRIRALLVLDDEDRLWGIITETDIDWKVNLESKDPHKMRVGQIMTPLDNIVAVDVQTSLEECKRLMKEHAIRHLPVVRNGGIPEGVISTTDFAFES